MENTTRRQFLGTCLGGVALSAAAATGYGIFRYLAPHAHHSAPQKVEIPEKEIAEGAARFFDFNGDTAVIIRSGGKLLALSAVCTHLGCIVQWQKEKQQFLCPCHAGTYSREGAVLGGPPPRPLTRLPFSLANGTITIG